MIKTFDLFKRIVFIALMLAIFTSCSDDDGGGESIPTEEPVAMAIKIDLFFTPDYLSVADLSLWYLDVNGIQQCEPITSSTVSKTIVVTSLSQSIGYCIYTRQKVLTDTKIDSYSLGYSDNSIAYTLDKSGNVLYYTRDGLSKVQTITATGLANWIGRNEILINHAYNLSSDNKLIKTSIDWNVTAIN